jgi:hypothetical protein
MFRYKAVVEVVTTLAVTVYATSEEEAYEQLEDTDFFTDDTAIKTSMTVVSLESDGI